MTVGADTPVDTDPYDEFAFLPEVAAEAGVDPGGVLPCARVEVTLGSGQVVSGLRWGDAAPTWLYLHGGGQNAHTWDNLMVLRDTPSLCLDLPGHGRSDRRADRDYGPWANAAAASEVIDALGLRDITLVGMSLGGASAIHLAAERPDAVTRVVIIDVTPAVNKEGRAMTAEQRGSVALIGGPPTYDSYEAMVQATLALSPLRTEAGIRRGVRHNALRREDGQWTWRYDLFPNEGDPKPAWVDFATLWDDAARIEAPTMLVKGAESAFVLPEDIEEFQRRTPGLRVEIVAGAGHAVQSDQPAALNTLLNDFAK